MRFFINFGSGSGRNRRHHRYHPHHAYAATGKPMGRSGLMVLAVIGLLMMVGSGFFAWEKKRFIDHAIRVEGTVVELVERRSTKSTTRERSNGTFVTTERDSYTYAPVFTYKDSAGKEYRIASSVSSNPPAYAEGEKVTVLYDPNRPGYGEIDSTFSLWSGSLVLGGVGLVLFLVGLFKGVLGGNKPEDDITMGGEDFPQGPAV